MAKQFFSKFHRHQIASFLYRPSFLTPNTSCNLKPRFDFPKSPTSRFSLFFFRCGGKGHRAKFCRMSIRCFRCGDFGHKRFECSSSEKKMPRLSNLKYPRGGRADDSWLLQMTRDLIPRVSIDYMLLDPDVVGCFSRNCNGFEGLKSNSSPDPSSSDFGENVLGSVEVIFSISASGDKMGAEESNTLNNEMANSGERSSKVLTVGIENFSPDFLNTTLLDRSDISSSALERPSEDGVGDYKVVLVEDLGEDVDACPDMEVVADPPSSFNSTQKAEELDLRELQSISLARLYIIDFQAPNCDDDLGKGDNAFYIKLCKFFLYCFLAAHRMLNASLPPISS